jgi:uncharacterized protein
MILILLSIASTVGWFISSLAGGGSSLILIPVISLFLGAAALPPVITIGGIFGNSERAYTYREHIDWDVLRWDVPGAVIGACLGAFTFTRLQVDWLAILVAIFLFLSACSYAFKKDAPSFTVRTWHFLPASFVYAFLSGVIGSMGPLLVPFYLNYGLRKESLLATLSATRILIHVVKLISYAAFGALTLPYAGYGILIGLAAFPGNWLAHRVLERLSEQRFRQMVTSFVMISAMLLLWQQRGVLGGNITMAKMALWLEI